MPRLEIMERVMLKVVTFHFYLIIDPQLVMSAFLLVDLILLFMDFFFFLKFIHLDVYFFPLDSSYISRF